MQLSQRHVLRRLIAKIQFLDIAKEYHLHKVMHLVQIQMVSAWLIRNVISVIMILVWFLHQRLVKPFHQNNVNLQLVKKKQINKGNSIIISIFIFCGFVFLYQIRHVFLHHQTIAYPVQLQDVMIQPTQIQVFTKNKYFSLLSLSLSLFRSSIFVYFSL